MTLTYNNEAFTSQSVPVDIAAPALARPTITITSASTSAVSANWTAVPDAQIYYMRALNNSDVTSDKSSPFTTTTSATIPGLTLDTTKNPSVFVYAFNFDASTITTITFPSVAKMSSQGKAVTIPTP